MRNNGSENIKIREQLDRLGRPDIETLDKEIVRRGRAEMYKKLIYSVLGGLVVAAAIIVLLTNLLFNVLQVDGTSMNPRLQKDDVVLAYITDEPAKNDVIAFYHNNKILIKRVIGAAGDWININDDGVVTVNGDILYEPYVTEQSLGNCDLSFPYQVPSGTVFVMGDNRPLSMDSRLSQFGSVGKDQIIGKVVLRMWPFSRLGSVS